MKIKKNKLLVLLGVLVVVQLIFIFKSIKRDKYIIPKNYQDCLFLVVYDIENGEEELIKNGSRIFNIPSSGVLEVNFTRVNEIRKTSKFYIQEIEGELKELKYVQSNEWDGRYEDSLLVVSTLEIGELNKQWTSFVVMKYGDKKTCSDRHKSRLDILKRY